MTRLIERAWSAEERQPENLPAFGCPPCLPGLNQQLVQKSWAERRNRPVSEDGRLRLRGPDTLDICATPGEVPHAIRQFARWLDYLAGDGVGLESRQLDGWRTCAIVDGEAVPIRIRERVRRISRADRQGAFPSRWLRPAVQTRFAPSGELELQILRMGAAFAAFPIGRSSELTAFEEASRAIRAMARQKARFERPMSATAGLAARERQLSVRVEETPAMPGSADASIDPEILKALAVLSALGSARLAQLLAAVECLAGNAGAAEPERNPGPAKEAESRSLVCLAESISGDGKLFQRGNEARTLEVVSRPNGVARTSSRARRTRQVA